MYKKNEMKDPFAVTNEEYKKLQEQFAELCYFAGWQLMRKNLKNNHTEDLEDVVQQLHMALILAGRYYKRQIYIESCLKVAEEYANDEFLSNIINELKQLWATRTKHGANKKKFGDHQEALLEHIIRECVPVEKRPNINESLKMDKKFKTYCKAIAWNKQKYMGKKITRERHIRSGQVSINQFDNVVGSY